VELVNSWYKCGTVRRASAGKCGTLVVRITQMTRKVWYKCGTNWTAGRYSVVHSWYSLGMIVVQVLHIRGTSVVQTRHTCDTHSRLALFLWYICGTVSYWKALGVVHLWYKKVGKKIDF